MIRLILMNLLTLFGYNFNQPARLDKVKPKNKYDKLFDKIAPYIIIFGIILLIIILLICLIKCGGNWFSSPQNKWEHMEQAITCMGCYI